MSSNAKTEKGGGVYAIINDVNGKFYIGSTVNFRQRRIDHWKDLKLGIHGNGHLQAAFNKYGAEHFSFHVMERVESPTDELLEVTENSWMLDLGLPDHEVAYNIRKEAANNLGLRHSEETMERLKAYRKTDEGKKATLIAARAGGAATLASGHSMKALQKANQRNKAFYGKSFLRSLKCSRQMTAKHAATRARNTTNEGRA